MCLITESNGGSAALYELYGEGQPNPQQQVEQWAPEAGAEASPGRAPPGHRGVGNHVPDGVS